MRLAFVTSSFPPYTSGVAVNAATIASGLVEKGHQVGVFVPEYGIDQIRTSPLVSPKLEIFRLPSVTNPFNPGHKIINPFHKSLNMFLKSFSPDIIHVQDPLILHNSSIFHHSPVVAAHQFPPSYTLGQFKFFPFTSKLDSFIFRQIIRPYQKCDLIITPTQIMANQLRSYGIKIPIQVISCGVDTFKFSPAKAKNIQPPVILYLGRISPEKHIETLIYATKYIKSDCQIWIAGTGKAVDYLKALSQPYPNVKFLGYIDENLKPNTYNLATIFVMPSTAESQSIVSLESAACGLPLVLANAAALPELIDPLHPNGLLFTPRDPIDLAAKIDFLLAQSDLITNCAKNSRLLAKQHDLSKVIKIYENAYLSLI